MQQASVDQKGHPKGLYVLFVTELWERFSYYGMRAIFVLFMTKALFFNKELGSQIYGSYTGLVYLTPLLGGYMADRYWGNRKSIIIGGILMALGQFFMFLSGYLYNNVEMAPMMMFVGLGLLIFGNGFFKPNISTMVGQLYPQNDKRIDGAFTIFYMGINLGAFLAPLVAGTLGDTGHPQDFKWGFLAACIGMVISVIMFVLLKNHYLVTPEGVQIGDKANNKRTALENVVTLSKEESDAFKKKNRSLGIIWGVIWLALLVIFFFFLKDDSGKRDLIGAFIFSLTIAAPGYIISDPSLSKIEKQRIWVIYIVAFFVIFFWAAFEQAGASLTYFAEEQTDRNVGLIVSSTTMLITTIITAIVGIYLSIQVAKHWLNRKGWPMGVVIITFILAIIYLLFNSYLGSRATGFVEMKVIPASFFQSINAVAIVIFAPAFAWLWSVLSKKRMEPASPYKQAIGLFLLALGYLVIAFGVKGLAPGVKVSMMWLISLYTIHTFGELCLSPIGLSMVNKLAPVKFASLLMGVWFLSTASANKFAGTLSSFYPQSYVSVDDVRQIESSKGAVLIPKEYNIEKNSKDIEGKQSIPFDKVIFTNIKDKDVRNEVKINVESMQKVLPKSFMGFSIDSLYDFFMLFVFMAGVSSIILFFLSRLLIKMMHGVK